MNLGRNLGQKSKDEIRQKTKSVGGGKMGMSWNLEREFFVLI